MAPSHIAILNTNLDFFSTRAYRMKLKEWGYTRNQAKARRGRSAPKPDNQMDIQAESDHESDNDLMEYRGFDAISCVLLSSTRTILFVAMLLRG